MIELLHSSKELAKLNANKHKDESDSKHSIESNKKVMFHENTTDIDYDYDDNTEVVQQFRISDFEYYTYSAIQVRKVIDEFSNYFLKYLRDCGINAKKESVTITDVHDEKEYIHIVTLRWQPFLSNLDNERIIKSQFDENGRIKLFIKLFELKTDVASISKYDKTENAANVELVTYRLSTFNKITDQAIYKKTIERNVQK